MTCILCKNWTYIGRIKDVHKINDERREKLGTIPPIKEEDNNIYGYCEICGINALKVSETTCGSYCKKRGRYE